MYTTVMRIINAEDTSGLTDELFLHESCVCCATLPCGIPGRDVVFPASVQKTGKKKHLY